MKLCASPETLERHRAARGVVSPVVPASTPPALREALAEAKAEAAALRRKLIDAEAEIAALNALVVDVTRARPGFAAYTSAEAMGLTAGQCRVYAVLSQADGPISKWDIARAAATPRHGFNQTSVTAAVDAIRRKLAEHGAPVTVQTIRGCGYRLAPREVTA